MKFTKTETKLLRLSLDPSASPAEAEQAWMRLLKSLRKRNIRGYDVEENVSQSAEPITAAVEAEIKKHYREIGRKGGAASRGTYEAHQRAKKAAQARWKRKL
jgi:general stress protein YciG